LLAALSRAPPAERADIEKTAWNVILRVYTENVKAVPRFTPQPLPSEREIPALYVTASMDRGRNADLWKEYFPQLAIEEVSGEHASVYTGDRAPLVAAWIAQCLEKVE
jgi:thioesterase domain-containing protein